MDNFTKNTLGIMVLVGFFGLTAYTMIRGIPPDPNTASQVGQLLGIAGTLATAVVMYHYGSSAGSALKDKVIEAQQTETARIAVAAAKVAPTATESMNVEVAGDVNVKGDRNA
jgi:hypothetical protein